MGFLDGRVGQDGFSGWSGCSGWSGWSGWSDDLGGQGQGILLDILKWQRFLKVIHRFLKVIHRFLKVIYWFLKVILTRGRYRAARAAKKQKNTNKQHS